MSGSISVDLLSAFVQVAQQRSVSAAARELGLGKSLVSKRVAQLEAAVKTVLFSRSTRRVALTPAGEAYLDSARRALAELQGAEERLRELRSDLSGPIRLTAPVSWGQRVLARRLPEFLRLHPAIEVELQLADRMLDLAYERIDIALRWSSLPTTDLSAVPVAQVPWVVVAAPDYLAQAPAGLPDTPQALAAHPCMTYWRTGADDTWTLDNAVLSVDVRVRSRYHADNPEAVAEAALAGLGVALLPRYLCEEALADGRLSSLLPDWTPRTRFGTRIMAVAAPERLRVARNRALLAFLQA